MLEVLPACSCICPCQAPCLACYSWEHYSSCCLPYYLSCCSSCYSCHSWGCSCSCWGWMGVAWESLGQGLSTQQSCWSSVKEKGNVDDPCITVPPCVPHYKPPPLLYHSQSYTASIQTSTSVVCSTTHSIPFHNCLSRLWFQSLPLSIV